MTGGPWKGPTPPIIPRAPRLPVLPPERPGLFWLAVAVVLGLSAGALGIIGYLVGVCVGWIE